MDRREHGPIEQLRIAAKHPMAGLLGAVIGGWVPLATYTEAHTELLVGPVTRQTFLSPISFMVAGGLLYSAKTVWQWGRQAFGDPWKATGFVALLEGVMVCSHVDWLSRSALVYLATINAIATGCRLAARDAPDMADVPASSDAVAEDGADEHSSRPGLVGETTAALVPPSRRLRAGSRGDDALYQRAVDHVRQAGSCSTSAVQRALGIGYNKAAKLVERMERDGVIGPPMAQGRPLVAEARQA